MRSVLVPAIAGAACFAAACKPAERATPPEAHAPASLVALSGAALFIGAGDIGVCGSRGDERTAQIVDSVLKADSAVGVPTAAFTTGDNAYPSGLDRDFVRCFTPSWGDPEKRIMKVLRPTIGNHDYQSARGAAYYRYFGARAGPAFKGYYSFDLGEWHVVALNSEMIVKGTASEIEEQQEWLKKDLRNSGRRCTVAYFHHPLFSSGAHGPNSKMRNLWKTLSEGGVDLVLNGHEHHYERFLPMNAAGVVDSLNGMEQIIVGTGGGGLTGIRSRIPPESARRIQGHWGVLIATLGTDEYRTSFLDVNGRVWDPSGRKCH
jgi:acid phosphatase type 7